MTKPLRDKTALITGATRGLGFALSLELAKKGAHIIAVGRTVGGLEELDDEIKNAGGTATLVPLDLLEEETLDGIGPSLFSKFKALDFFIANAAYLGALSPASHFKTAEWEKVLGTNLKANWQLIRSLDPLLKQAEHSTALFITDETISQTPEAYWGPYAASKAGLEALVKSYANECDETKQKVQLYAPCPMSTNLRRKAYPGEDQSTLTEPAVVAQAISEHLIENNQPTGALIQFK